MQNCVCAKLFVSFEGFMPGVGKKGQHSPRDDSLDDVRGCGPFAHDEE
jgi:hypothetical protein